MNIHIHKHQNQRREDSTVCDNSKQTNKKRKYRWTAIERERHKRAGVAMLLFLLFFSFFWLSFDSVKGSETEQLNARERDEQSSKSHSDSN